MDDVRDKSPLLRINLSEDLHIAFDRELVLKLTLCIAWAYVSVMFFHGVFVRLPILQDYADGLTIAIFAVPVVFSLPAAIGKLTLGDFLFFFFCVFYVLSCYVFYPENAQFIDNYLFRCLFCVLPFYFLGRLLDFEALFKPLLFLSVATIWLRLFYFLVFAVDIRASATLQGNEMMWEAYQLMPHVGLVLWSMLERFRLWKALTLLAGLMFLLSCGTRGPFAILGFFGVCYFFFYMKFKGSIYVKMGIIAFIVLVIATLEDTLFYLVRTFTDFNLSTRIIEKFLTGELGDDSYRSILRDRLYELLGDGHHFFGYGAFGSQNFNIIYAHFLPLDLFFTFGYFLGGLLLLLMLVLFGYAFWIARGRHRVYILFLFAIGFLKLMLSNTFLLEPYLFMLIGACVKEILEWYHERQSINEDVQEAKSTDSTEAVQTVAVAGHTALTI